MNTPPQHDLPILQKATAAYLLWHEYIPHLPRSSRFTLGSKVDRLFLETIEYILVAGYTARDQKVIVMQQASAKLDALKFFLKVTWWANALSTPKYAELSIPVADIGKMLGGWHKQLTSK